MTKPPSTELSLKPYSGKLHVAFTPKGYEAEHLRLFKSEERLCKLQGGRFSAGCGKDGYWTYLVWASNLPYLAHELSHVVLHVFELAGIDPREAGGEPFCYMLSQLLLDYQEEKRQRRKSP